MQQEIEELGFDLFRDGAQDEYERRAIDLEQESFRNSEIWTQIKSLFRSCK